MIRGSMVALITPFNEDGSVNYDKLRELVEWHIAEQTDAILVLGTTAETPALTITEEDEIARISIETAAGRVPIIVGSGSNNTMIAMEQSIKYEKMGADALLVITPYYNKTNKAGMVNHFYTVADAVNIPIYVYNVPGRTGVSLTYEALAEISKHKNIVGIKEASGDMSFITKISRLITDDFNVYCGNDDISIPLMSMGGAGIISVLANILPRQTHEMAMAYLEGDVKKAADMQKYYLDFINALFIETNPIPIKEAMNLVGMNVGGYRMPLCPMEEDTKAKLIETMKAIDLL
ncbi:4-hydroxy-tetrahydrodipicolinate synthase [Ihubacter massiliensis]|uniref:4-hydroxy-tetrahydrodipicolinate synthase n=1 Tax=Hominibacterium faecale TaxID=2839743 RepID=A0A9J6QUJ5_9FIRM|nr:MULTISPECIES: 4-hydroxy-tetrahydrodipicolinate synthase [Eubacteriales Family XIII. Incertae Sedis]MCO7123122.1 4-hydroxy-tetrahydrodipicolinate synthase [Ihubacter massiliensis]MCU7377382.1 4-hydroxy-tetrahydrodipicolinate synthase [Hominibacterium faecale]